MKLFANADEPEKLERLCCYISRPAISEQRLSITKQVQVRYELKTPYRDGTTGSRRDRCVFLIPSTLLAN
ncbi:transposase [Brumicola pallidula]|uniref:transposase n=1 Tax=Brumicola pallidula TaxID=56807 RepID=UPI001B7FDD22|nr:transposase [Glaciecola pallidula]